MLNFLINSFNNIFTTVVIYRIWFRLQSQDRKFYQEETFCIHIIEVFPEGTLYYRFLSPFTISFSITKLLKKVFLKITFFSGIE